MREYVLKSNFTQLKIIAALLIKLHTIFYNIWNTLTSKLNLLFVVMVSKNIFKLHELYLKYRLDYIFTDAICIKKTLLRDQTVTKTILTSNTHQRGRGHASSCFRELCQSARMAAFPGSWWCYPPPLYKKKPKMSHITHWGVSYCIKLQRHCSLTCVVNVRRQLFAKNIQKVMKLHAGLKLVNY